MKDFDMDDIISVLYFIHFGDKDPELVTCKDCNDFYLGCTGGADDVLNCMYNKAESFSFFSNIKLT